ncbi:MAG: hypothetical protein V1787_04090 [Candidatus Micrarchaeota archaeon]
MVSNRRIAVAVAMLALFIFLVLLTIFSYQPPHGSNLAPFFEFIVSFHVEFMVLLAMFGVVVGAGVFFLVGRTAEKKGVEAKVAAEMLLRFLNPDDKVVVRELLKNGGRIMQAEISRLPGMTRLKAHRVVQKLEQKGVVDVSTSGKLRVVHLKDELKGALL